MNPIGITRRASFPCLEFSGGLSSSAIVWLHGSGERGTDLSMIQRFGLPALLADDTATTNADVICPQLEAGAQWDAARLQDLLCKLKAQYGCIALLGYSLGGAAVCDVLSQYGPLADLYIAIAGRARAITASNQAGTRLLAVSGALDPRPGMHDLVRSVRELGGLAEALTLAGQGHFISETALGQPRLQQMLSDVGISLSVR